MPHGCKDPLSHIRDAPIDRPSWWRSLASPSMAGLQLPTGASRYINGSCALDHLHRLRAHVDAVLRGSGEPVIADDPAAHRAAGSKGAIRPGSLFDPNGRLPRDAEMRGPRIARERYVIRTRKGHRRSPVWRKSSWRRSDEVIPPRGHYPSSLQARAGRRDSGGRRSPYNLLIRRLRRASTGCMSLWRLSSLALECPAWTLPPIDALEMKRYTAFGRDPCFHRRGRAVRLRHEINTGEPEL